MILSINIFVGTVHDQLPDTFWDSVGTDLSQKFSCELEIYFVDTFDTKLSINGDLTTDEMLAVQYSFSSHLETALKQ